MAEKLTSGLPGFDRLIKGLLPGDNLVWRVDTIQDYDAFAAPYAQAASTSGRPLVYFRFAAHPPLAAAQCGAEICELQPREGFEPFVDRIHAVIDRCGAGAFYVFDCLSDLAEDWHSDAMLGNFFVLTCPYLFDMEAVAYFGLRRRQHTPAAVAPIVATAQIVVDVYRHRDRRYVRPLKVQHRYSPRMNMLHACQDTEFQPVISSALTAAILQSGQEPETPDESGALPALEFPALPALDLAREIRALISRDERMFPLFAEYLTAADLRAVRRRLIGSGLIGGKAAGMLLARAIVRRKDRRLAAILEPHDSFYVGSDVFYTYLVRNGIWRLRRRQRDPERCLEVAEEGRQRILTGSFSPEVLQAFEAMLDYFGQAPFIVRSSSLLEDAYGNSFAGKYESIFCVNQGPRERRLENLLAAVRSIYASSMSEKALRYRAQRGLLDRDEQMSLLVMRVSGFLYGHAFFPHVAGVGFSFNPYAWHPDIDPAAGVLRLVFGLGTRAVDRADDDYTRLVALNAPERRPESGFDELRQYSQRRMDYLDLDANQLASAEVADLTRQTAELPLDLFFAPDGASGADGMPQRILTFERLLRETPLVADCRRILALLEAAYANPVDIEFTANFEPGGAYTFSLLQCRPLQVQGIASGELPTLDVAPENLLLRARGAVIGQSRLLKLDRLVYVVPAVYGKLPLRDRYEIARLIGRLNRADTGHTMLLGPGRWGTRSPSLGIPVAFAEINRARAVCELVQMHEHLTPDASLGTHFLNELVELNMLYLAVFPDRAGTFLAHARLLAAPNRLTDHAPDSAALADAVRVVESRDLASEQQVLALCADARGQAITCFLTAPDFLDGQA